VRARETAEGLVVNFHCGVDEALSVAAVHEHVDTVERAVRLIFPDIVRVIGHAEPTK
jgi:divalent metal cation (Fe/Co/Zn/Cd) transporter